jgi:hypothetical protein
MWHLTVKFLPEMERIEKLEKKLKDSLLVALSDYSAI